MTLRIRKPREVIVDVDRLAVAIHAATRGYLEHEDPDPDFCRSVAQRVLDNLADDLVDMPYSVMSTRK
jgi:hypothetical protein